MLDSRVHVPYPEVTDPPFYYKFQIPSPCWISFYQSKAGTFIGNINSTHLIRDNALKTLSPKHLKRSGLLEHHTI